ncbi:creatininase family protein [Breznakia pachnodae]|uniref:Creatinine amidohydrolase n=1 Tax=Breznakia pachnodae TaxID=265178 RepID=A0ABU0E3P0_9FIRM|nr:creatininase family protein [Breznakia pachnodae]MDQ0361425.1 creatinine amidohydrolase [Breznakia pachnodae]
MEVKKHVFMKDMTWPELEERFKNTDIALIPAGQTEQHGKHLPIDVDNIICTGIAERVALATYDTAKPVVAPTIPFGYADIPYFRDFPGTFSLRAETLVDVYYDVCMSLIRQGVKKIIFINGHYPNPPFIDEAVRRAIKATGAFFAVCNFFVVPGEEVNAIFEEMGREPVWGHACLIETSVSQVFGAEVRHDLVEGNIPGPFVAELKDFVPIAPAGISIQSYEYEPTAKGQWNVPNAPGPQGDPSGYSDEIGERVIKATVDPIAKLINDIKEMKVEIKKEFFDPDLRKF